MSQRSKFVQAGRMTSANLVSPSIQMPWLTTNSSSSERYMRANRLVSVMVPKCEPPYL